MQLQKEVPGKLTHISLGVSHWSFEHSFKSKEKKAIDRSEVKIKLLRRLYLNKQMNTKGRVHV